jgi:hypothetical protein
LLNPFNGRLGREAAVDRFIDAPRPTFIIGEHLVGIEDFGMLAAGAEFRHIGHAVDLLAHLVKSRIDTCTFGLCVFSHCMFDTDIGLVKNRRASSDARDERQAIENDCACLPAANRSSFVNQAGIGDEFRKNHRRGLQSLNLDFGIFARISMLDRQNADGAFRANDGHTRKTVEPLFAGFGHVAEGWMGGSFIQVQRFDIVCNGSNKAFAERKFCNMNCVLIQTACGKQLKHTVAQQIYRAHLARQSFADDIDDLIELCLRVIARGHHLVQAGQYITCGDCCAFHATRLADGMGACDTPAGINRKNYVCLISQAEAISCVIASLSCNFCFLRRWIKSSSG